MPPAGGDMIEAAHRTPCLYRTGGCDRIRTAETRGSQPASLYVLEKHVDTSKKPTEVADDVVVSIDYTLRVDDEIVDTSDEDGPWSFSKAMGM